MFKFHCLFSVFVQSSNHIFLIFIDTSFFKFFYCCCWKQTNSSHFVVVWYANLIALTICLLLGFQVIDRSTENFKNKINVFNNICLNRRHDEWLGFDQLKCNRFKKQLTCPMITLSTDLYQAINAHLNEFRSQ